MIVSIKIESELFPNYEVIEGISGNLNNLDRINIFIGANNSGKSRFLRYLLNNSLSVCIKEFDSISLTYLVEQLKNEINTLLKPFLHSSTVRRLEGDFQQLPHTMYVDAKPQIELLQKRITDLAILTTSVVSDGSDVDFQAVWEQMREIVVKHKDEIFKYVKSFNKDLFAFEKTYIPILRGLRPAINGQEGKNSFDISINNYLLRTNYDYAIKTKESLFIHTGLELFKNITQLLLGDHEDRLKVKDFEDYLKATFFDGRPVHIVPRIGKDVLYIKIGDEKQYPIHDLGEGIQAIILLTYPLFFNVGKNMLFFIEEPELHLHPGLERIFIETLRNPKFNTFQYFITSHSNHLLDLTLEYNDISVYSFQKKVDPDRTTFLIRNVNSNHKQILDLLGVRNSSVFLANCTIWVEGITDRIYLRKYLEILQKQRRINFKEDFHYSFVEYAGSNITHWSFLESDDEKYSNIEIEGICSKIFLIADSDGIELPNKRNQVKKRDRQKQLKQKLGENFYATKGLEIENMLTKNVIKNVIMEMEGENSVLNFSLFDKLPHSDIYIGDFIATNVTGLKRKYRVGYATIANKLSFCKQAVNHINTIDDLSEEAQELANRVLDFISNSQ